MQSPTEPQERRTSADVVFDFLYEEINSLNLLPGTKISEAEIAAKFGVSRQPVRDAFSRLGNHDLVLIRPQRATVIKKFSLDSIKAARFMRLSVELEVLRKVAANWNKAFDRRFDSNMALQKAAMSEGNADAFHRCDYDFHKLLCEAADAEFAFKIIEANKAQVDRLCVLSLTSTDAMPELFDDHTNLLRQLRAGDESGASKTIRKHLSRLDTTVEDIYTKHESYFET